MSRRMREKRQRRDCRLFVSIGKRRMLALWRIKGTTRIDGIFRRLVVLADWEMELLGQQRGPIYRYGVNW